MKKIIFILLFCYLTIPLSHSPANSPLRRQSYGALATIHQFTNSLLYAEVNLLEPLRPGIEGKIEAITSPEKPLVVILEGIGFALGENYWELPFLLAFRPTTDYEFGTRTSIRANKQAGKWKNNIADTLIAGKYLFFRESIAYPTIFAEAGISLPSGNYNQGFGNGTLSLLLAGGMERTIGEIHEHILLNYRYNLKNPADYQFGNVFGYTAGLGYLLKKPMKLAEDIILVGDWKIFGELKGWYHTDDLNKGVIVPDPKHQSRNELYFSIGAKYKSKWGKYALALLLGLTKESSSYQVYFSARY